MQTETELVKTYRPELPLLPRRMRRLPVERGYPVPWFVAFVDGHFDFRVQDQEKRWRALREKRCWLCGDFLGAYLAFVIGPMCAINRTSSEPPSHRECAEFAVLACPFLNLQEAERRISRIPGAAQLPPGVMIERNPGVVLIWITKTMRPFRVEPDYLITIGDPDSLSFWREGRPATRDEIMESIESGYPLLWQAAEKGGPRVIADLERRKAAALGLLPAA